MRKAFNVSDGLVILIARYVRHYRPRNVPTISGGCPSVRSLVIRSDWIWLSGALNQWLGPIFLSCSTQSSHGSFCPYWFQKSCTIAEALPTLHDLGLTEGFDGPLRFEVEGANAARTFARNEGMDDRRSTRRLP